MQVKDVSFETRTGRISALEWGGSCSDYEQTILAAHGWLDNAASFHRLAPLLLERLPKTRFLAIDLPGHGKSDHLKGQIGYPIWVHTQALYDVLTHLQGPVHLLAHSMGAGASTLLAGSHPDKIRTACFLDALGPMALEAKDVRTQFSEALEQLGVKSEFEKKSLPKQRIYESLELAVKARIRGNLTGPGLVVADIEPVVSRNLRLVANGFEWRTDPVLRMASPMRLSQEVLNEFLKSMDWPVMVLMADQGIHEVDKIQSRYKLLPSAKLEYLPGHHYFHLDAATVSQIAVSISGFIKECTNI